MSKISQQEQQRPIKVLMEKKETDHGRDRTCNLLLRRQTPYPLGHAAAGCKERNL